MNNSYVDNWSMDPKTDELYQFIYNEQVLDLKDSIKVIEFVNFLKEEEDFQTINRLNR